ncbi:MAG: FCD domain-containing protein [Pilosibacter sp.]
MIMLSLQRICFQVRIMLEPQIAALAAQCAKEHEIKELEEILEEMEAAMKKEGGLFRSWIRNSTRRLPSVRIIS